MIEIPFKHDDGYWIAPIRVEFRKIFLLVYGAPKNVYATKLAFVYCKLILLVI